MGSEDIYYKILGLNPSSSLDEVKRTYKKLVLKHHPDRGGDIDRMAEINLAYHELTNVLEFNQIKKEEKSSSKTGKLSKYRRIPTKLKCPKCFKGDVILVKNTETGKGFFACSEWNCDYNGGPFNQDESLLNTLDYCHVDGCDGLIYKRNGKYGSFTACTFFPVTGCKAGRQSKKSKYKRISTSLECPECGFGKVVLVKNTETGKGFFACSERDCDYNGGPFNQDESLLNTLDYCPADDCNGLTYKQTGMYGDFKACTFFPITGCKAGRK